MPIGTPHGTLDYKQVSKVTFVGASSNTVIDTTTGSLGVGVGVGGPTSNLHVVGNALITGNVSDLNVVSNVNMLHTSNTASIKLNSNVVAEFPRSKKLIKYPRVAMTSAAQSSAGDYEGYIVNQSSVYSSENSHGAYKSFRGNEHWLSSSNSFDGGNDVFNETNGPWISIQLPTKIKLEYLEFSAGSGRLAQLITAGSVYASNNGSTWINIGSLDNLGTYTNIVPAHVDFTHTTLYDRYLLHITANGTNYVHMEKLSLYGVPEYDPEAHGTDVTVKSYPNVPNTDWLEVYYDAKNYTNGDVQDLSTNSFNGTLTNGASFNNSDGIDKFVFDGSNDYISGSIPSTFTGNQTYTFSIWVKPDSHPSSGFIGVFGIGTDSQNDSIGLFLNSGNIVHLTYNNNLETTTYAPIGKWVHITGTYDGTGRTVFMNGELVGTDSYSSLTLTGTTFKLGSNLTGGQNFDGSIANFRLFNRALTSDEIYQLYAYQKEDFGHGDLGMTLKAGRLGIGTSEPRAALDVRGDVHISGSLRKTRALMFIRNSGSYGFTTQTTFQTVVDYGPPWVAYSTNPLYNISHTGDYTDTNYHHLYLRIAVKNESTGDVVYFPDSTGWRYYVHTTHQRLDEHSYQGIFSGLIVGNSYRTRYEIKPRGQSSYNWNSIYGDITGIVWD